MIQHSIDSGFKNRASARHTHRMRLIHSGNNALLRELLSDRLTHTSGIDLVASTLMNSSLPSLISQLQPDVTLLTLKAGSADNHEMPWVRSALSATRTGKVVIMAPAFLPGQVSALSREGANGFLLDSTDWQTLVRSLVAVHRGSFVAAPEAARAALTSNGIGSGELTPAEVNLMELVSTGLSNHEIATRLNISDSTVRSRLGGVMAKLQVTNRTQAVTQAIRLEYVSPGQLIGYPLN
jgi:DNA-binding NarL/FixJ family response regulator